MYKNKKLNNLSSFEQLHEVAYCPICLSKLYEITNYMEQSLDGDSIVMCADNESHTFNMDKRTHELKIIK